MVCRVEWRHWGHPQDEQSVGSLPAFRETPTSGNSNAVNHNKTQRKIRRKSSIKHTEKQAHNQNLTTSTTNKTSEVTKGFSDSQTNSPQLALRNYRNSSNNNIHQSCNANTTRANDNMSQSICPNHKQLKKATPRFQQCKNDNSNQPETAIFNQLNKARTKHCQQQQ